MRGQQNQIYYTLTCICSNGSMDSQSIDTGYRITKLALLLQISAAVGRLDPGAIFCSINFFDATPKLLLLNAFLMSYYRIIHHHWPSSISPFFSDRWRFPLALCLSAFKRFRFNRFRSSRSHVGFHQLDINMDNLDFSKGGEASHNLRVALDVLDSSSSLFNVMRRWHYPRLVFVGI